jgi:hypothetical protein
MTWKLSNPVLKETIAIHNRGTGRTTLVEVSTSSIPNSPETCLFWPKRGLGSGSAVVQTYSTWDEAREGHAKWAGAPDRVAQAMIDAGWEPQ